MNLLKKISKDKLVIMVTHNAELAEEYSTRIVRISDGKVTGDSNPYEENKCVIVVTHSNELARQSDEVIHLNKGDF